MKIRNFGRLPFPLPLFYRHSPSYSHNFGPNHNLIAENSPVSVISCLSVCLSTLIMTTDVTHVDVDVDVDSVNLVGLENLVTIDSIDPIAASSVVNIVVPIPQCALLRCEHREGVIICLQCRDGFLEKSIKRHFSQKHRIKYSVYWPSLRPILAEQRQKYNDFWPKDWKEVPIRLNKSVPVAGLAIRSGYACNKCGFLTLGHSVAIKHRWMCHPMSSVFLQCWNTTMHKQYWTVQLQDDAVDNKVQGAVDDNINRQAAVIKAQSPLGIVFYLDRLMIF